MIHSLTELGNLERFINDFKGDLFYIPEEKQWRYFHENRWIEDKQKVFINDLIIMNIKSIYADAKNGITDDERKKIAQWAMQSESRQKRDALLKDAECNKNFVSSIVNFDQDHFLLNVQNGTIDLKTGKLLPHNKEHYITKISPVIYDESAICPAWKETIETVFENDISLIEYFQSYVGYAMTGSTKEQCLTFSYGDGANGKSTVLETLFYIFGDYSIRASIETFVESQRGAGSASEDVARLKGARYVEASEISEGQKLNESILKDHTGGDTITARNLYSSSFDFQPTYKLFFFGNHKPRISGQDHGIKRRIKLIPFLHTFRQPIKGMKDTLIENESPGILNWMIEGCLRWQRDGLVEPDIVSQWTDSYFKENDTIGLFIDECTTPAKIDSIPFNTLFEVFETWGGTTKKAKFSRTLQQKGFSVIAGSGNKRYIQGIRLKNDRDYGINSEDQYADMDFM